MIDVRRWSVVAAVLLGAGALVGGAGGAAAQAPPGPTSSTTTSTTVEPGTSPTTVPPPPTTPAPPELLVGVGYDCPVSAPSGGGTIPVLSLSLSVVNTGGPAVVDVEVNGVIVEQGVDVPTSYLGIPQQVRVDLPPGEPEDAVVVELLASGTDRSLGGAGLDHRPVCEGTPIGQLPPPAEPAAPRSARPAFTG